MHLVGDDIGHVPTVQQFLAKLDHVNLTDDDFTTRNFAPGSGGQSAFYKVLVGELEASDLYDE